MNIIQILTLFAKTFSHSCFPRLIELYSRLSFPSFCKDRFIASEIGMMHQASSWKDVLAHVHFISSTSCSLGTNQKLHTSCSKSNFTLTLKISNFLEIYSFSAFSVNKRKWKLLRCKTKHFLGRGKNFCPHYFWVLFLHC